MQRSHDGTFPALSLIMPAFDTSDVLPALPAPKRDAKTPPRFVPVKKGHR